jgi:hypothetical protein
MLHSDEACTTYTSVRLNAFKEAIQILETGRKFEQKVSAEGYKPSLLLETTEPLLVPFTCFFSRLHSTRDITWATHATRIVPLTQHAAIEAIANVRME